MHLAVGIVSRRTRFNLLQSVTSSPPTPSSSSPGPRPARLLVVHHGDVPRVDEQQLVVGVPQLDAMYGRCAQDLIVLITIVQSILWVLLLLLTFELQDLGRGALSPARWGRLEAAAVPVVSTASEDVVVLMRDAIGRGGAPRPGGDDKPKPNSTKVHEESVPH